MLSGEGHNDWVSCVEYSPNGLCLASTSGDGTVKLWNTSSCINTFSEHQQPGDVLVCSSDQHCRYWLCSVELLLALGQCVTSIWWNGPYCQDMGY